MITIIIIVKILKIDHFRISYFGTVVLCLEPVRLGKVRLPREPRPTIIVETRLNKNNFGGCMTTVNPESCTKPNVIVQVLYPD